MRRKLQMLSKQSKKWRKPDYVHTGGSCRVFLIRLELSPRRLHFVTPDYFSPQGQNQSAELKEANKLKVIRMALHIICRVHAFSWTLNKPERKNGAIRLHSLLLTRTRASYLNCKVLVCRFTQLDTPPPPRGSWCRALSRPSVWVV